MWLASVCPAAHRVPDPLRMTTVIFALYGLLIGSFLTVVVDRVPQGGSVVAPPSRCGSCGLRLGPLDLVPVLSWAALRGKCRQCFFKK